VTLVSVPGFGDLKVEVQAYYDQEGGLWRADMWSPTFVNNQAGEDVDWVFGSAGRRTVAAGESSTRQDSEWSLGTYRLFLNDSGHMASVDVHCWVKGDSFEAVSMGIVQ
jgi:hypothetical protein